MWLSGHVIPILGDPRSGQSGREKRRRKFLRTGERALDATLNEPVPRLISEASIYRTAFVIFLYDGVTYKLFLSSFYACPSEGVSFGLRQ